MTVPDPDDGKDREDGVGEDAPKSSRKRRGRSLGGRQGTHEIRRLIYIN